MMIISKENILSLIPQRPPFVMIDDIIYSDETLTRSGFLVKEENIFVTNGVLREPGLMENIAQTAGARAGLISRTKNKPVAVGYIGSVRNLEVFGLPRIGDVLETEITIENQVFDVTMILGRIRCNDVLIAQCEMKIFITK